MPGSRTFEDAPDDPGAIYRLNAACGFLELGMPEDALRELEPIIGDFGAYPVIPHLQLIALISLGRFDEAAVVSRAALQRFPEIPEFYIHGGTALGALRRTGEARALWGSAPPEIQGSGIFQFNLAFCEWKLGDRGQAQEHLRLALALDPSVRGILRDSPELRPLLESD